MTAVPFEDGSIEVRLSFPKSYGRLIRRLAQFRRKIDNTRDQHSRERLMFDAGRSYQSRLPKIMNGIWMFAPSANRGGRCGDITTRT